MKNTVKNVLKKMVYCNPHVCALSAYMWKCERSSLIPYARKIRAEENTNLSRVVLKMIWSNLTSCCSFEEYYALHFYKRTAKNQRTFLTRFYNHVIVNKYNEYKYNSVLCDKTIFNERFQKFRNIRWLSLKENSDVVIPFLEEFKGADVIVKPYSGHSGSGVMCVNATELLNRSDILKWIDEHKGYICEERIYNHRDIRILNPTSLNTIRAITFNGDIVWTGLRIGRRGEVIDNISQGGSICSIDMNTGKIDSDAFDKAGKVVRIFDDNTSIIGYQLPLWNELIVMIKDVCNTFPYMKFIAWDFAITDNGPVLIEGNNGIDNRISQVHLKTDEDGLRPILERYIKKISSKK